MANLRKNLLSLVSVYGQENYLWTNLRIFSYSVWQLRARWVNFFRLLPPPRPHCTFETRGISRAPSELFFCYYPLSRSASEISVFFWIPLGQPCIRYGANNYTFNISTNNNLSLSEYTFFTSHRILMQQCHDNLINYGMSYPCLRSRGFNFFII